MPYKKADIFVTVSAGFVEDGHRRIQNNLIAGQSQSTAKLHVFKIKVIAFVKSIHLRKDRAGKQHKNSGHPIRIDRPIHLIVQFSIFFPPQNPFYQPGRCGKRTGAILYRPVPIRDEWSNYPYPIIG